MGVALDVVFLILFPILAVPLLSRAVSRAERIAAAWPPPDHERRFDATGRPGEEIGYLSGTDNGAIQAAIARLRVADAIAYDTEAGRLVPTGNGLPDDCHPLAAAVHAAVIDRVPAGRLRFDGSVAAQLRILDAGLVARAWWRHDVPPGHFGTVGLPALAYGVAGVVWALVPPFRWYTDLPLILMALVVVVTAVTLCRRPSDMETIAQRELRLLKESNAHLNPDMYPSLRTYGPAVAALAVGLFGLAAMRLADPAIAGLSFLAVPATADKQHASASGSGGDASGCGTADAASCSSGCGGGCGGGGCGGCGG